MGGILHRRFGNFGGMSPWLLFGCLCPACWLPQGQYLSVPQLVLMGKVPIVSKRRQGHTLYNSIRPCELSVLPCILQGSTSLHDES